MMFRYLLKRILWIIPALWFITSVVFILIKLIPGEAALLLDDETRANSNSREDIYRQYLERTGQNLPIFYFSIRSAAQPDSIHKIRPYKDREFFKRMSLQYSNWPLIVQYYTHLKILKSLSNQISDPELRTNYRKQIAILFASTHKATILQTLSTIEKSTPLHPVNDSIAETTEATITNFTLLQQHKTALKKYIPAISWHGSESQYHKWLMMALKGDLGISLRDARPVSFILREAISNTFLLSVCSLLLIFVVAIMLNLLIVHEDYQWLGKPILNLLYITDTIPLFMLALLLLTLVTSHESLLFFPVFGLGTVPENASWLEHLSIRLYHLVIPVTCLTLSNIPYVVSQLHTAMNEVKHADFIQTARAKGVAEWNIVRKHIFKNSLLPLITLFSGFIPALLGGAVVIEVIFVIPGMGQLLVGSVLSRDYPVILGIVLIMSLAKIIAHMIADILYYLADPRIRF